MDTLRIVTLSRGGRPVPALDLNDGETLGVVSETFKHTPAAGKQQLASENSRYGRTRVVGETHGVGKVEWTAMVAIDATTTSHDVLAGHAERLVAELASALSGRLLEFRAEGLSLARSSFFEIAGPAEWQPGYEWRKWGSAGYLEIQISIPVQPLVRWAPMTIRDVFDGTDEAIATMAEDYTQDAGVRIASGSMQWGTTVGAKKVRHTARGYAPRDVQVTVYLTTGLSVANLSIGVTAREQPNGDFLTARIERRSASSSVLVLYRFDHTTGTFVQLGATVAITAIGSYSDYWVRLRTNALDVTAELFTTDPTPMGTPAATLTYVGLDPGTDGPVADHGGDVGISAPAIASLTLAVQAFSSEPYTTRNVALPEVLAVAGVPGNAPALADVDVTTSGGTDPARFALLSWSQLSGIVSVPGGGQRAFGRLGPIEAQALSGWTLGSSLATTVSGASTQSAEWDIDPAGLAEDDFSTGEIALEVWAAALVDAGVIAPSLYASLRPFDGDDYGAERFTVEPPVTVPVPQAGTKRKFVRLGVLIASVDRDQPGTVRLRLRGETAAGSAGTWGVDYLWLAPARGRALSPTAKPYSTYPVWVRSTSETTKTIRSDLAGRTTKPGGAPYIDHGLGGVQITLPPGDALFGAKLSTVVPNQIGDTNAEKNIGDQETYNATVALRVTPRSFFLRDA